jgi:signal transduction histidine kinase/ActR/RegA family two-component response regulator
VARLVGPTLAVWGAVDLIDPQAQAGASARQVVVAHVDETKVRLAREFRERYPPDPNAPTGVHQVIRSGKSELYVEIPQALLEGSARDADHLRMIRELRLESAMVVPLRARGRSFGAVTFVYADSGRRYGEDDLAFAEDFARRAAMAIDNALVLKETDAARAQERLLRNEAEMASRAKDEFLATVSHELRTPLNAILGWTVTLRRRNVADDVDRALAIVERNARLQTKLIEDVLDIARIISGKLALNLGPTNVAEAATAAVETVTPAADAKQITVSIDVPDKSLTITADADRLQQIVWNLLANAVKFTPKYGSVAMRAYRDGSDVCISVTDTGEGMRRDVLPLVFEPFQQADASTTRRHGGLGLGLAIVKRLVSAHGGVVRAESEGEGKGATFTVRLPARAAVPAISRAPRATASVSAFRDALGEAPRLDGLRLLVVDDEEDALTLVREALSEQGAEVHVAASAREALEKFTRLRPDVIVSDIGMPEADGFFLIRKIRALPIDQGGRTPAVALTAYARTDDAQRAFAAGYQMHVAKPVEPTQLATVVANLGGRSLDAQGSALPS